MQRVGEGGVAARFRQEGARSVVAGEAVVRRPPGDVAVDEDRAHLRVGRDLGGEVGAVRAHGDCGDFGHHAGNVTAGVHDDLLHVGGRGARVEANDALGRGRGVRAQRGRIRGVRSGAGGRHKENTDAGQGTGHKDCSQTAPQDKTMEARHQVSCRPFRREQVSRNWGILHPQKRCLSRESARILGLTRESVPFRALEAKPGA